MVENNRPGVVTVKNPRSGQVVAVSPEAAEIMSAIWAAGGDVRTVDRGDAGAGRQARLLFASTADFDQAARVLGIDPGRMPDLTAAVLPAYQRGQQSPGQVNAVAAAERTSHVENFTDVWFEDADGVLFQPLSGGVVLRLNADDFAAAREGANRSLRSRQQVPYRNTEQRRVQAPRRGRATDRQQVMSAYQ